MKKMDELLAGGQSVEKKSAGLADEYARDLLTLVDQIKASPDDYRHSDPRFIPSLERMTSGRFEGREVVGDTVINVYLEPDINNERQNKYVLFFPQIFRAVEDSPEGDPFGLKKTGVESAEIGHMDLGLFMDPEKQDELAERVFEAAKLLADPEKFGNLKPEQIFAMLTQIATSFEDKLRK